MALIAIGLVCATALTSLVLVLRHLVTMRATDGEIAELRKQWTEGSTAIATAQATLDAKLTGFVDKLQHVANRTPTR
jgi:hypothetical protein